uniref:Uncharacterized protein n=1 Tax=viral metagenome TaxID=1070528 RepID=A0A6C0CC02_9ZZZZ
MQIFDRSISLVMDLNAQIFDHSTLSARELPRDLNVQCCWQENCREI